MVHKLFEEQAFKIPYDIAVMCDNQELSYLQLNKKANQLANYLRANGVGAETLVAIAVNRSLEMVISLLAILKAGGAYVPVDPDYPKSRLQFILEDTKAPILITQTFLRERFQGYLGRILSLQLDESTTDLFIEEPFENAVSSNALRWVNLSSEPYHNLSLFTNPDNLAYVIYTSGSTGKPKGVMVEYRSLVNCLLDFKSKIGICSSDKFFAITSLTFDIAALEIFLPLISGAKLLLTSKTAIIDPLRIQEIINNYNVSILQATPSFLQILVNNNWNNTSELKILCGGESISLNLMKQLKSITESLWNVYGPTETTIWSSFQYYNLKLSLTNINIGKPISNTQIYILDEDLTPVSIGVIGEIYIGGLGLARGYLNRPDLTAEKFIPNPFINETIIQTDLSYSVSFRLFNSLRLYRTGDLARYLSDGTIEFLGRIDNQVKIRGHRIELDEIESTLVNHKDVTHAVVVSKEEKSGIKKIVAYIVPTKNITTFFSQKKFSGGITDEFTKTLRKYLALILPEYMIPSSFIYLNKIPLTSSGKIDRNSLTVPDVPLRNTSSEYVRLKSTIHQRLTHIWSRILKIKQISIYDDFFEIGGDSIITILLVAKARQEGIYFNIEDIFNHRTIASLASIVKMQDDRKIPKLKVNKVEEQVLSFAQERLWFIEKYEEGSNAYNIPMVYKLSNNIKLNLLESSIRSIVARHEILRTLIKEGNEGNNYQLVLDMKEYPLEIGRRMVRNQAQLDQELRKAVNHIFYLSNECPIKVNIYEKVNIKGKNKKEYYLCIVVHHIAFDGWSVNVFLEELQRHYAYHLDRLENLRTKLTLPELNIQYKDFALWQRSYLNGERHDNQLDYWKNKLNGYEVLNLITDKNRPSQIDYTGKDIHFELNENISIALRELAKELKVSLYSLLLSSYYLTLRVYSNQDDIIIGTPIANRHYNQVENLVGFFINSLALRMRIESKASIKGFIQQVGQEIVEAQAHQDLPFEKLVEELNVIKDTSRHPIFQVMFELYGFVDELYNQMNKHSSKRQKNITNLLEPYANISNLYNVAKFDISALIDDSQVRLKGSFNYAVSLYSEATINQFIKTYIEILKQFAQLVNNSQKQKQTKLFNLNYIDQEDYKRIVHKWNCTDKEFPSDKTIAALFEEQVRRTPDNVAIISNDIKLTYKELNERSNQLAHYLKQIYDIKPDMLIALCLDRNEHMLIAILGVLKAGGAYVPLDPSYPEERVKYILEDTKTEVVLTNVVHRGKLEDIVNTKGINILAIDSDMIKECLIKQPKTSPEATISSTNLAYVIYTSGSTGNPKGVMIEHKAYVATIDYVRDFYFTKQQGIETYSITNYVFDIFGLEYGLSLLSGGCISVGSNEFSFLDCTEYDFIQMTPSICDLKLDCLANTINTKLFVGGENLSCDLLNRILSKSINVVNVYGPTETTIWSTSKLYKAEEDKHLTRVSLGKPFGNEKVYVLDVNLVPLPIGAIGELYIGGEGLARGYWGKQELTAERFITNPFQTEEEKLGNRNTRIYRTGDLVRWLEKGELEYIGRNDFQVKVRGHRIELGEIEAALSSYEGVKQSVVVAKEHINIVKEHIESKYIVGYYVSEIKLDEEGILSYLRGKLPEYMVPSVLVHLERLPLTVNGKLDRKGLPAPEFTSVDSYVAPRNELERKVCQIWAEVLGLDKDKVGIRDDFFRLGGNSILAIRLISKLNKELNSQIRVKDIFELKSIFRLVEIMGSNDNYKDTEVYVPFSLINKGVVGL